VEHLPDVASAVAQHFDSEKHSNTALTRSNSNSNNNYSHGPQPQLLNLMQRHSCQRDMHQIKPVNRKRSQNAPKPTPLYHGSIPPHDAPEEEIMAAFLHARNLPQHVAVELHVVQDTRRHGLARLHGRLELRLDEGGLVVHLHSDLMLAPSTERQKKEKKTERKNQTWMKVAFIVHLRSRPIAHSFHKNYKKERKSEQDFRSLQKAL
jgi:hypothetical protein